MKIQELACYVILVSLLLFFVNEHNKNEPKINILHEADNVAVPEDYRKIIGYDSLQMIFICGKWKVNFCYPNEWVTNQLKFDTTKK